MDHKIWSARRSGKENQKNFLDHRSPYERDHTRVIHASSFRKLQRKTQIHSTNDGDFHRTRLTHSLEVASIGRSITHHLKKNFIRNDLDYPDDDLISTICLLHDIGHPPFGHAGEKALNIFLLTSGGFESNAQTLRLISKLEGNYAPFGLDLTRRTMLGILKYLCKIPNNFSQTSIPIKGFYDCDMDVVDWLFSSFSIHDQDVIQHILNNNSTKYKQSIDCSIMNLADDIAYGVHDLEDALHLKIVNRDSFDNQQWKYLIKTCGFSKFFPKITDKLFSVHESIRKQAISYLVHFLICSSQIEENSLAFDANIFKYNAKLSDEASILVDFLHKFIFDNVILNETTNKLELLAFDKINFKFSMLKQINQDARSIADTIASMSDHEICLM